MKVKPEPCRCGALNFPHRYSHWCDAWLSQHEEDSVYEWDDCDAHHAKTDDMSKPEYDRYMGYTEAP